MSTGTPSLVPILAATLAIFSATLRADEPAGAEKFSFSTELDKDRPAPDAPAAVQHLVSPQCISRLKNQKVLLLIAERTPDQWLTTQERYGPLFNVIESRLKSLGLKPYTQPEIKAQIAQAEVDAYFKNDPDAALAASKRLGANYILRGNISSQTGVNPVVQVNEVAVNIELTLSTVTGRVLSEVTRRSDSFSGGDTLHTAVALMQEQADSLVAQLYNDYCREGRQ